MKKQWSWNKLLWLWASVEIMAVIAIVVSGLIYLFIK